MVSSNPDQYFFSSLHEACSSGIAQRLRNSNRGFTLVELMTVIAIVAVMSSVGIPLFRNLVSNNCVTSSSNLLVAGVQLARSEAAQNFTSISVDAIDADWSNGLLVWQDLNADGVIDGDEQIRSIAFNCSGVSINEAGGNTRFVFSSSGEPDSAGTFSICGENSPGQDSQVAISATGRPASSRITCPQS